MMVVRSIQYGRWGSNRGLSAKYRHLRGKQQETPLEERKALKFTAVLEGGKVAARESLWGRVEKLAQRVFRRKV